MNARAKGNWQGMNWIRQDKRLAIYLRDGCACAWCGKTAEEGAQLTLDHVVVHSRGGSNDETNLVTACMDCNRRRYNRSAPKFAAAMAAYLNHGIDSAAILANVRRLTRRSLKTYRAEAKASRRAYASAPAPSRAVAPVYPDAPTFAAREDQRPVNDARAFALGGNAVFTVVSRKTGTRFTFKVRQPDASAPHFVSVLNGPDNDGDYAYLGTIFADGTYRHGKKSYIGADAPSARAFAWFWSVLGTEREAMAEVWHEGRCCRCGRRLTVPSSIEAGIGPECAGKEE
jgi:hypothetical protein